MKSSKVRRIVLLLTCSLFSQGILLAEEKGDETPKLVVRPLSLKITNATPEDLGGGNLFNPFGGGGGSGIELVVSVTPDTAMEARLVPSEAALSSFRDNKDANLLGPLNRQGFGSLEPSNNLTVASSRNGDSYRLEIRSPKTPSAGASSLEAKGSLLFAPKDAQAEVEHPALALIHDEVVKMGPARLKFTKPRRGGAGTWYVQILPGPEMADPAILVFGADKDIPILNTRSGNRMTSVIRKPGKDPFNGIVARGFRCPKGELSRIKIRYSPRKKLIEVPFEFSVGLGDFAGAARKAEPAPDRNKARERAPAPGGKFPPVSDVLVPPDSEWKWQHPLDGADPAAKEPKFHRTFFVADYDDADWKTGKDSKGVTGGFGYGEQWFQGVDIGTPKGKANAEGKRAGKSAYFRHRFSTEKTQGNLELRCQRDDGIVVYLDGSEVARNNMSDGPEAYLLPAASAVGEASERKIFRIPLEGVSLPAGEHVLAISLHNTAAPSSDLRIGGITLVAVERSAAK